MFCGPRAVVLRRCCAADGGGCTGGLRLHRRGAIVNAVAVLIAGVGGSRGAFVGPHRTAASVQS